MKNPVRKIIIIVAVAWGSLWYLSRQSPPEQPLETTADPETREQVMALFERSKKAGRGERDDIQEQLRAMGPTAVPVFVECLENEDPTLRAFAADALKYSGDISVAPHLEARLTDNHMSVQMAAVTALGQLGAAESVPSIIPVLEDRNREVRFHAALALGRLRDDRAVLPLVGMLHSDPYPAARQAAAHSLGEIGSMKALRSLKAAADDPDPNVRSAAESAVKQIKHIDSLEEKMDDLGNWVGDKLRDLDSSTQGES